LKGDWDKKVTFLTNSLAIKFVFVSHPPSPNMATRLLFSLF
jgi:hypothetical protein